MSLDLAIMGPDKHLVRWVPIGVDAHEDLLDLADQLGLPLMARMRDYYADATITAEELPAFKDEIESIRKVLDDKTYLRPLLTDLQELTEEAIRSGRSLEALAD